MNRRDLLSCRLKPKSEPAASMGPEFYTNAVFHTHEGKQVRMYDDLIKGKITIINFFYASCARYCPRTMACLAKVQKLLGDHLGRDMFMYSFTLKPDQDTPEKLKEYRTGIGARPGWIFLTGNEYDLTTMRFKLFRVDHPLIDFDVEIHASMLRIINDDLNLWTSWVLPDPPHLIRETISWVEPTKPFVVRARENAEFQIQINQESATNEPKWDAYKRANGWRAEVTEKHENREGIRQLQSLLAMA
jgi:protein SCO1/2